MATIQNSDPIVGTSHGKVRGKVRTTIYDDQFYCFDGIPYGKPPLGALRFKPPQDAESWNGILECTEVPAKCLQYNRYTKQVEGSEDCLYLNVYAKKLQSEKPLPVMVYLHGGGFNTGDATRLSWGPDYFMMKDVLFITIGYRMGALGNLSFSDPSLQIPGNAGLKDQILALKWIQKNCHLFNGDPKNVTLFGHSSGSGATQLLMLSPQCKGLFHKAILMAGFSLYLPNAINFEHRLAQHYGYEGEENDQKIYDFLCTLDADKLVHFNFWTQEETDQGYYYPFVPRIEPYETADAILTKQPIELFSGSWSNGIPIMLGGTSQESLLQYKWYTENPELCEIFKRHTEYLLPQELQLQCPLPLQRRMAQKIIELHYGNKELCVENVMCAIDLASYGTFYHSKHRIIHLRLSHSMAPTFLYRFDFDSPTFNLYRIKHCGPNVRGVGHVAELSYLFYMPQSFKLERESVEFVTIQRMIDMWTAFAATSDPNTRSIKPNTWKPVERLGPRKCLNISNDVSVIECPEAYKCSIWDSLYEEARIRLY